MKFPALAVSILVFAMALSVAAEDVTNMFTFNPPDGISFIKTSNRTVTTRTKATHDSPKIATDVTVSLVWYHKTPDGFEFSEVDTNLSQTVNGQPFENPMMHVLLDRTNTLVVSAGGDLLGLKGWDTLAKDMETNAPTSDYADIEKRFSSQGNLEYEKQHWELFLRRFIGRGFKRGDVWKGERKVPASGGSQPKTVGFYLTCVRNVSQTAEGLFVTTAPLDSTEPSDIDQVDLSNIGVSMPTTFARVPLGVQFSKMLQVMTVEANTMLPVKDERMILGRVHLADGEVAIVQEMQVDTYRK
jgi:hypothetical protein